MSNNHNNVADEFYQNLPQRYLTEVRRFVPKYDEMAQLAIDFAIQQRVTTVLDIGSGVGNIDEAILSSIPQSRITAVEVLPNMMQIARDRCAQFANRIQFIICDIADFKTDQKFDYIFSNLVLHNTSFEDKARIISSVFEWLTDGGVFIWSDLICFENKYLQNYFMEWRRKYALRNGASKEFADENFKKETEHDYMLTVEDSLNLLKNAGFSNSDLIFAHDTSATFYATK